MRLVRAIMANWCTDSKLGSEMLLKVSAMTAYLISYDRVMVVGKGRLKPLATNAN